MRHFLDKTNVCVDEKFENSNLLINLSQFIDLKTFKRTYEYRF